MRSEGPRDVMYGFGFRLKQRYADTVGLFSQDTLLQQRAALNHTAVYLTPEICCWSGDKTKDFFKDPNKAELYIYPPLWSFLNLLNRSFCRKGGENS